MPRPIVRTLDTCTGSPRIDGTRLTCANVVMLLHFTLTIGQFLETHDYLTLDDILEALRYCSAQQCLIDKPDNFCCGCTLDLRPEEPPSYFLSSFADLQEYCDAGVSGYAYLGSPEQYERDEEPEDLWILAKACLNSILASP